MYEVNKKIIENITTGIKTQKHIKLWQLHKNGKDTCSAVIEPYALVTFKTDPDIIYVAGLYKQVAANRFHEIKYYPLHTILKVLVLRVPFALVDAPPYTFGDEVHEVLLSIY